jgi:Stress responsive A/B Barrel Domain
MQKSMKSRRQFIQTLTLAGAASLVPIHLTHSKPMATQKIIHQVYFWLHKESDIAEFLRDAVPMLGRCKDVKQFYQGVPAPTEKREVVDHSFHASCTLFFDSLEGQAAYQQDPIHLEFIARYSKFWKTVKVYDIAL